MMRLFAFTDLPNVVHPHVKRHKMLILCQSIGGVLTHWQLDATEKDDSKLTCVLYVLLFANFSSSFYSRLDGHQAIVDRVIAHPTLPYVASIDRKNEVILWKSYSAEVRCQHLPGY